MDWTLHILKTPEDMFAVEDLQRLVWPDSEIDIVPTHLLMAIVHSGGLVIGAFKKDEPQKLIGFVFGFSALEAKADQARPWHHSHQLGVHPDYRNHGLGSALKRAQWQMARHQGLERITWTYDPLMSINARLNIAKLGAVCNTYLRNLYGEMRDGLNVGIPSDRFRVDWWVHSLRVIRRLSRQRRLTLDLAHYLDAGSEIINRSNMDEAGWPLPPWQTLPSDVELIALLRPNNLADGGSEAGGNDFVPVLMVEIPADYLALKAAHLTLALEWRLHTRELFEHLFAQGYLVTDFVYLPGAYPRSFYVLSHGEQTL